MDWACSMYAEDEKWRQKFNSKTWMDGINAKRGVRACVRMSVPKSFWGKLWKPNVSAGVVRRLRSGWPEHWVSISSWVRDFSLHYRHHTCSHPYPVGTETSFPTVKRWACCTLCSGEVMNAWRYTSTTFYIFMVFYLIKRHDMKTYVGVNVLAPAIFHLVTRFRWEISSMIVSLPPRKQNQYPLGKWLCGSPEQLWT